MSVNYKNERFSKVSYLQWVEYWFWPGSRSGMLLPSRELPQDDMARRISSLPHILILSWPWVAHTAATRTTVRVARHLAADIARRVTAPRPVSGEGEARSEGARWLVRWTGRGLYSWQLSPAEGADSSKGCHQPWRKEELVLIQSLRMQSPVSRLKLMGTNRNKVRRMSRVLTHVSRPPPAVWRYISKTMIIFVFPAPVTKIKGGNDRLKKDFKGLGHDGCAIKLMWFTCSVQFVTAGHSGCLMKKKAFFSFW